MDLLAVPLVSAPRTRRADDERLTSAAAAIAREQESLRRTLGYEPRSSRLMTQSFSNMRVIIRVAIQFGY